MKKVALYYHKEDNDGVFSGAIIYKHLLDVNKYRKDEIDLFGVGYDDMKRYDKGDIEGLYETYDIVIMTDISFNDPEMMHLMWKKFVNNFIWIDHHAPIIKASFGKKGWSNCPGERNTNHSAIFNAYRFFWNPLDDKKIPELFKVLSAWDSFTYEQEGYSLDYVQKVNVGTAEYTNLNFNTTFDWVNEIIDLDESNEDVLTMYRRGDNIVRYENKKNENLIKDWGDTTWTVNGRKACMLMRQGGSSSLMFESCPDDVKNGIVLKRLPAGTWVLSLYNVKREYDEEFDCGAYLKENYKGGGHKGAAGCQLTEKQFINILKDKKV